MTGPVQSPVLERPVVPGSVESRLLAMSVMVDCAVAHLLTVVEERNEGLRLMDDLLRAYQRGVPTEVQESIRAMANHVKAGDETAGQRKV